MKSEEPVIDPREVKKEPIKNVLDEEKMIAPQEAEEPNRMIAPQKAEEPRQYIDNINAFFAKICSESNIYDTIREVFE
jgi:outer membrane biosynthesis protein TonB